MPGKKGRVWLVWGQDQGSEGISLLWAGISKRFGLPVKCIESVGAGVSANDRHFVAKQEPLIEPGAVDEFLGRIAAFGNWSFFRMAPVAATSRFNKAFAEAAREHGLAVMTRPYATGYKIVTDCGWQVYEKSLPKKFRKNIQACSRKILENNLFQVRAHTDLTAGENVLDIAGGISAKSWKAGAGTDIFNPAYKGFWKQALQKTLAAGKSTVWVLYYGSRPVAYEWHLRQGGCIIALKADYDREFAGFSPGNMLAWHGLQNAFESGASHVDLLMGGGAYKKKWATHAYPLNELLVFNKTLHSRAWRQILSRQDRIKGLYRRLTRKAGHAGARGDDFDRV